MLELWFNRDDGERGNFYLDPPVMRTFLPWSVYGMVWW